MEYLRTWESEQAERLAAHVERTAARIRALADHYAALRGNLGPGRSGNDPDELFHYKHAGPRVPLRLDVVDLRADVALYVRDLLPRVRYTVPTHGSMLRDAGNVPAGLAFMAGALGLVYERDRDLGDEVARGAWELESKAALVTGQRSRPFALVEDCPECSQPALWVVPERLRVVCGNPACSYERLAFAASRVTSVIE